MNATEVKLLVDKITGQIDTLKNTGVIDEMVVIPVSVDYADQGQAVCIKLRGERYFIAYDSETTKPISVLWSDMSFIRKNFGIERYNPLSKLPSTDIARVNSPVTFESLNYGRIQNIADYQKAIDLNVSYHEVISNLQEDGTFGTFKSKDEYGREITVQRVPNKLTKACKTAYERDIAKGLYVICKFVGEVDLGFSL
jgi:hypothetical protein